MLGHQKCHDHQLLNVWIPLNDENTGKYLPATGTVTVGLRWYGVAGRPSCFVTTEYSQ
jgi:hypothetical protein